MYSTELRMVWDVKRVETSAFSHFENLIIYIIKLQKPQLFSCTAQTTNVITKVNQCWSIYSVTFMQYMTITTTIIMTNFDVTITISIIEIIFLQNSNYDTFTSFSIPQMTA